MLCCGAASVAKADKVESPAQYKFVILGGGNAAGYAAREFVANGLQAGQLCIITDEPYTSYERPALSKGYLAPTGAARLPGFHACVGSGGERQAPEWYTEKGITYMTNTKVTSVDLAAKALTLDDGAKLTYHKLIIATGARPMTLVDFKLPGADLGGVFYLRNVKDADALVAGIAAAKEQPGGAKAVVIGGGYIGMEVAAALASNAVPTTVVMPEQRLMQRLLTPQLAAPYEKVLESKGVTLLKGASSTALEGEGGKVSKVVLKSTNGGEPPAPLEANLVVVGVGARANVELFAGKLDMDAGGIKVNGLMATSAPDVYAIGDVAAFPLKQPGGEVVHVRQEHVTHARSSAAQAAKAALGLNPAPYDYLPFFYSRIFNLAWQFYGFSPDGSTPLHFGNFDEGVKFGCLWLSASGELLGGFLEGGSNEDNAALKKAVVAKVQLAALLPAAELAASAEAAGAPGVGGVDLKDTASLMAYLAGQVPAA